MRFLVLILISWGAIAAPVKLAPIEQQIKEADGVLIGHYLSKKIVTLDDDGKTAIQMIIKIQKEFGLQSNDFGLDEVIIHYPTETAGVPSFVTGEKVALFMKSVDNRYWGHHLGLGAFKVVNYGKDTMLMNSIYPHHPQGQIHLPEFERKVKHIKGSDLKIVVSQFSGEDVEEGRTPASVSQTATRAPASTETEESQTPNPGISAHWLLLMLAGLGAGFRLARNHSRK